MGRTKKKQRPEEATTLTDLPAVGLKTAGYLREAGIKAPSDLVGKDPDALYVSLYRKTETYFDPCLLDQFIGVTAFMNGKGKRNWWSSTPQRQRNFHRVANRVKGLERKLFL